jgi:predicted phosphoribosyltransferase
VFRDRTDAGRRLAELVADRLGDPSYPLGAVNTVVMGREVEQVVAELRPAVGPLDMIDRMVIVVDDGVATGATARAAAAILRRRGSGPVILATATAPPGTCASLRSCFDDVICLETPRRFGSVGRHYEHFEQVSIGEVRRLLSGALG